MQPTATDVGRRGLCLCPPVWHCTLCKNGRTDRDAVWRQGGLVWAKEARFRWGPDQHGTYGHFWNQFEGGMTSIFFPTMRLSGSDVWMWFDDVMWCDVAESRDRSGHERATGVAEGLHRHRRRRHHPWRRHRERSPRPQEELRQCSRTNGLEKKHCRWSRSHPPPYHAHTCWTPPLYCWSRPRHVARLAALARSWWRGNKNVMLRPSVST